MSFSQKHNISFSPGMTNKIRLKYETTLNSQLSAGTFLNFYYANLFYLDTYNGLRLDPFVRIYPNGKAPKGIYLQAKGIVGYFNSNIKYYYTSGLDTISKKQSPKFFTYGAGFGLGYQFIMGRNKTRSMELFFGVQYSKLNVPLNIYDNNKEYYTDDDYLWYTFGPGSFLNGNFGIGYSF